MNIYLKIILVYIILAICGLLLNLYRMKRIKFYYNQYAEWVVTGESSVDLMEHQSLVDNLVKKAGKGGYKVPIAQPMGYGQIATYNANPFDAFPTRIQDIAILSLQLMKSSVGIYRARAWNSLNPLYWLGILVFLPRTIVIYLGFKGESFATKFFNLLWWIFTTVVSTVLLKENSKAVNDFITAIFK